MIDVRPHFTRRGLIQASVFSVLASTVFRPGKAEMIEPKTFAEQMMYLTTELWGSTVEGLKLRLAQASFFNFKISEDKQLPVLITNKHVVRHLRRPPRPPYEKSAG